MDNHKEFYINLELQLNEFLVNSNFEFIHLYTYLYTYCVNFQHTKYKDCREEVINFYHNILTNVKDILYNFNLNTFETIINSDDKLRIYSYKYNDYNDNLKWLNKLTNYINTELSKLDTSYNKLDFTKYGLELWFNTITLHLTKFINSKLTYYLDFKNYDNDQNEIYYLNEIIDNIYYLISKQIIDQKLFNENIGNNIIGFIEINIIDLGDMLYNLSDYLILIEKYDKFYETRLLELNLNYLHIKTQNLYKTHILDSFNHLIKNTLSMTLDTINDPLQNNENINTLSLVIKYIQDKRFLKTQFNTWLTNNYKSQLDDAHKIEAIYFYNQIYNELLILNEPQSLSVISLSIDNLFLSEFKNNKNTIEMLDKYIRNIIYKNDTKLHNFIEFIVYYFTKYIGEEMVFQYYKNYLVRRLYKYNFNDIELTILNEIINRIKTHNLYKLNLIKNDIYTSKEITLEFNEIYNLNNNIHIITNGIWDISTNYNLTNNIFKKSYKLFTDQFDSYYHCKFANRKIEWNNTLSNCILDFNINNKTYNITCPIIYADILYYFNDKDILVNTNDKERLDVLCQYKLIKTINEHSYALNTKFNYKKSKFTIKGGRTNLNKIKKKQDDNMAFTQTDLLELFIVRTLKHNELETRDLIKMILNKYNVKKEIIYKTLDKLVDKCYLSSVDNKYLYVI